MKKPEIPKNEVQRIKALHEYQILDTEPELQFDDITLLASYICKTPIALVNLVDEGRVWCKSHYGLGATEAPRDLTFCAHAINSTQIFVVADARSDGRFKDNPHVTDTPSVIFYAGAPLVTPNGHSIGTICVVDHKPRSLDREQLGALSALARQVIAHMELRKLSRLQAERQRFLAAITNSFPGTVAYWSKDLKCYFSNAKYQDWFGRDPDSMAGIKMQDLLGKELFARNEPYIHGVLAGTPQRFERTLIKFDGSTSYNWVQYVPDLLDGQVMGFVAAVSDITDLRLAENALAEQKSKLISASKLAALGEMAGGIAHEINTPLAIIQMKTEWLKNQLELNKRIDSESTINDLTLIESTVERIGKIIEGLRFFSRTGECDATDFASLKGIIEDTLTLCQERFRQAGIKLKLDIFSDIQVKCRKVQISQILLNLLNNSFDAVKSLSDKWVMIKVHIQSELVRLEIEDSGSGIEKDIAEKIMQPFFTTKDVGKGVGLGLSISLGIAQEHHGTLFYEPSSPHTRFVLELPIRQKISGK